jgi:hypothetical protein
MPKLKTKPGRAHESARLTRQDLAASTSHMTSDAAPGNDASFRAWKRDGYLSRKELLEWLKREWRGVDYYAGTITFGRHDTPRDLIRRVLKGMLKTMNEKAFGKKAVRRHGRKLGFFAVYEGMGRNYPHCHFILEVPAHEDEIEFESKLRRCLENSTAIESIDIQKPEGQEKNAGGWLSYLLKRRDKTDLLSDSDFELMSIPRR